MRLGARRSGWTPPRHLEPVEELLGRVHVVKGLLVRRSAKVEAVVDEQLLHGLVGPEVIGGPRQKRDDLERGRSGRLGAGSGWGALLGAAHREDDQEEAVAHEALACLDELGLRELVHRLGALLVLLLLHGPGDEVASLDLACGNRLGRLRRLLRRLLLLLRHFRGRRCDVDIVGKADAVRGLLFLLGASSNRRHGLAGGAGVGARPKVSTAQNKA